MIMWRAARQKPADYWEAEERADELLRSWLSPDQLKQHDECGHFEVIGSDTGKRYRICRGHAMNIYELDADGQAAGRWCFAPEDAIPTGDVVLAQKIALETFETKVLAIANRSRPTPVEPFGIRPNDGPIPMSHRPWLVRLLDWIQGNHRSRSVMSRRARLRASRQSMRSVVEAGPSGGGRCPGDAQE
jgi:hypothetical protein